MTWFPQRRSLAAFAHDIAAAALAWWLAFWLRFNLDVPEGFTGVFRDSVAWVVPLKAAAFLLFGLYRGIWRYASLPDLKRILVTVVVAAGALTVAFFMLRIPVPRSVLILDPLLLLLIMVGSRAAYRIWKEQRLQVFSGTEREPVFVVGSGDAAASLVKDLSRSPQWRVAGILDDSTARKGRQLHGVTVLGGIGDIAAWQQELDVRHAIVAMPDATHAARRRAVDLCSGAGLKVLMVPSFEDLMSGKVTVSALRSVELDDLLGRDPVVLDTAGLREWIGGKTVLVTGAGGSIGSELCRQIARFAPGRLVLLDASEFALYRIEQEFGLSMPGCPIVCVAGDVRNRNRIASVLSRFRPSAVFHAAAYKHVPLMENENAWEAVVNNALGTRIVAEAAREAGVEKFVLVSTDKAVNPTNVMGASKRLAEMILQALQRPGETRFIMVRFGNVIGSTGSVVPLFREQIARGGPVTVTHPEIRRYFMSIPEAAQLVLQAGLMGDGGEIFVLDMGAPVKIVDLARDMIRLSGLSEDDIRIEYTGLRPGEKLYEELLADDESTLPTPHVKLRIARARIVDDSQLEELAGWLADPVPLAPAEVKRALAARIPEYAPQPVVET